MKPHPKKIILSNLIISFLFGRISSEPSALVHPKSVALKCLARSIYPGGFTCLNSTLYLPIPILHKSQSGRCQVTQTFELWPFKALHNAFSSFVLFVVSCGCNRYNVHAPYFLTRPPRTGISRVFYVGKKELEGAMYA